MCKEETFNSLDVQVFKDKKKKKLKNETLGFALKVLLRYISPMTIYV